MIKVYNNGILYFNNKKYKCKVGKNGISKDKREGDGCTPEGNFSIGPLYYRHDRLSKIPTKIKSLPINKNMHWSDDSNSIHYNKLIYFKDNSCESLYREDQIYDLLLVIKYNVNPIKKKRGSAIFMHLANERFSSTKGCIALKKDCLINILKILRPRSKIHIINKEKC